MKKQKIMKKVEWFYIRVGGIFSVQIIKIWSKIHRKTHYDIQLKRSIDKHEVIVLASNHQSLLDPPAVFSALSFSELRRMSPVKFMTWHKYYNSIYKLPLYTTGCFPSHGEGHTGVDGAVYYAKNGYRTFIFPEGKRTRKNERDKTYDGIVKVLEQVPEARLILVYIDWEKRTKFFSRPSLYIKFSDAPDNIDKTKSKAIMDVIYGSKK
jgi:1-acyl-sn-glycerol-3-phosphate acyltransferase